MSRIRIQELMALRKGMTKKALARSVFHDDRCSDARKHMRIVDWNKGREFGPMQPKHILRLAQELQVTNINELFEDDGA